MPWSWKTPQGKPVFNYISEGHDFSNSERVLILATGFYEYTQPKNPKVKLKDQHFFTMKGEEWFWIAGIVKNNCFTMLTTEPGRDVKPYHDRQICVVAPDEGARWLDKGDVDILRPMPKGTLKVTTTRKDGKIVADASE